MSERETDVADLSKTIAEREVQLARSHHRVWELEQKLAEANSKLSSFSWKLTKPLRAAGRAFPRLAGVLQKGGEGAYWVLTLQLRERLQRRRSARLLLDSGLFDARFYLSEYKDVADSGINPLVHYLTAGAREGRWPNLYFDTRFYLENNPDVLASGINPLLHYLNDGFRQGREPSREFSGSLYLEQNPDVRAKGLNPLSHYLTQGRLEGRAVPSRQAPGAATGRRERSLSPDPCHRADLILRARDGMRRMLIIDSTVPAPDMDSGSVRMFGLMRLLIDMGWSVTFAAAHKRKGDAAYISALTALGAQALVGHEEIRAHLEQEGSRYATVLLSRPETFATYLSPVRAYAAQAELVYDSVELHFLRFRRAAELINDPELERRAEHYFQLEALGATFAQRVLVVTDAEKQEMANVWPRARVEVVPNVHVVRISPQPWSARQGLVFIGGFDHPPNVDAVAWFARDVLPLIAKQLPGIRFTVLGSNPPERVKSLACANIDVVGWVPDPEPHFAAARVFVAPLRFGAGMKGKIGQAMSFGLPVVTTSIGAEGMRLTAGVHAMIADEPETFAAAVVGLYNDEAAWKRMQQEAAKHIAGNFSENALRAILQRLFGEVVDGVVRIP